MRRVVVVGGSAAGARASEVLAEREGFDEVLVVSRDPAAPYYRPALSKQLLSGEWSVERARLPRPDRLRRVWRPGVTAVGLDAARRRVVFDNGTGVDADAVVLANGCRPRVLPGVEPTERVCVLHNQADASAIAERLDGCGRLLVVGAGLIGSEVAAIARKRDVPTTLVDPSAAPLARALGPLGDRSCMSRHAEHGCELLLGVGVSAIGGTGARVTVTLSDGDRREADLVVVCVGVVPDTAWLTSSGVPTGADGAVLCDATLTVEGHPWMMAAGDVASWWSTGARTRVEHWFTAIEHGAHVGANLARPPVERAPFTGLPFFWTEQHGVMVHVIGTHTAGSEWAVAEGDPGTGAFVALAATQGRTTGALLVGSAHRLGEYRTLVRDAAAAVEAP